MIYIYGHTVNYTSIRSPPIVGFQLTDVVASIFFFYILREFCVE